MELNATFYLTGHIAPEKLIQLPSAALKQGFTTPDELVAHLIEKDLAKAEQHKAKRKAAARKPRTSKRKAA